MAVFWNSLIVENPRSFLVGFGATWVLGMLSVAGINFLVDPYAQYGTGLMSPIVGTTRGEKVDLLQRASAPEEHVRGLILGSSRVLKFEPPYLQQRTGTRFFNAGVYYGRTEDYLAMLKTSRQVLGRWPEVLLVGVDVDSFSPHPGPSAELLRIPQLRRHIDHLLNPSDRLRSVQELLSWQQTVNSCKSLLRNREGTYSQTPDESFSLCGTIQYHKREKEIADGTYDFAAAERYTRNEYLRMYAGYDRLDPNRIQAWHELVDICNQESIELHVFLTVWLPQLLDELETNTQYNARKGEVLALLRDTTLTDSTAGSNGPWDLTELSTFAGNSQDFIDGIHPLEPNTRLMIDVMFPVQSLVRTQVSSEERTYAVQ